VLDDEWVGRDNSDNDTCISWAPGPAIRAVTVRGAPSCSYGRDVVVTTRLVCTVARGPRAGRRRAPLRREGARRDENRNRRINAPRRARPELVRRLSRAAPVVFGRGGRTRPRRSQLRGGGRAVRGRFRGSPARSARPRYAGIPVTQGARRSHFHRCDEATKIPPRRSADVDWEELATAGGTARDPHGREGSGRLTSPRRLVRGPEVAETRWPPVQNGTRGRSAHSAGGSSANIDGRRVATRRR